MNKSLRFEDKFLINQVQYHNILHYLKTYSHFFIRSSYHVNNIYYDTIEHKLYHDKESGILKRSLYRLRSYNDSPPYFFEEKIKINNQNYKIRYPEISYDHFFNLKRDVHYYKNISQQLLPQFKIGYYREAFEFSLYGEYFRLTLDSQLKKHSLSSNIQKTYPKHILELKYFNQSRIAKSIISCFSLKKEKYSKFSWGME